MDIKDLLLQDIAEEIRRDQTCPLLASRMQPVPGEGPAHARIAFIGEAPGAEEDKTGRPFVGRSGQLLRQTIREVGLIEEEVFIGNIIKCRPPENRDPSEAEIAQCAHYLFAQLVVIRPRLIVTLGRYSLNLLISPELKITRVRGQHIIKNGQLFLPTLHPSAVLRNPNSRDDFRRDLAKARALSELP